LDGEVSLDFGLGRGIAYYSGVVFEVRGRGPDGNSMGGGGRYDGLLQAFGGQAYTPAMGFAWSLERIVDCLLEQRGDVGTRTPGIEALLVRPASSNAGTAALLEAERLRTLGNIVELEMDARSLSDCLRYAAARKMPQVITVDSEGQATSQSVS
jgi:histidyl-tRNA synthetase